MTYIQQNLEHILAAMILAARAADIVSTYLATPTLLLESNPLLRKFRWPMALFSFITCVIPYFSIPAAIVVIVMSTLIAYSNSTRLWIIRAIGEDAYFNLMVTATAKAKVAETIAWMLLPALFISLLGVLLVILYPDPNTQLGFFFALGIFMYTLVIAAYQPKNFFRLRALAQANNQVSLDLSEQPISCAQQENANGKA